MKRWMSWMLVVLFLFTTCACAEGSSSDFAGKYAEAEQMMAEGNFADAGLLFESLGAYSDASQMAMYCKAIGLAEVTGFATSALFDMAIDALVKLGDFRDSAYYVHYYEGHKNESIADTTEIIRAGIESTNDEGLTLSYAEMTAALEDVDLEALVGDYTDEELSIASAAYASAAAAYNEVLLFKDSSMAWTRCLQRKDIVDAELQRRGQSLLQEGDWVCSYPAWLEDQVVLRFMDDGTYTLEVQGQDYGELYLDQMGSTVELFYEVSSDGGVVCKYRENDGKSGIMYMDDLTFNFTLDEDSKYLSRNGGGLGFKLKK